MKMKKSRSAEYFHMYRECATGIHFSKIINENYVQFLLSMVSLNEVALAFEW